MIYWTYHLLIRHTSGRNLCTLCYQGADNDHLKVKADIDRVSDYVASQVCKPISGSRYVLSIEGEHDQHNAVYQADWTFTVPDSAQILELPLTVYAEAPPPLSEESETAAPSARPSRPRRVRPPSTDSTLVNSSPPSGSILD